MATPSLYELFFDEVNGHAGDNAYPKSGSDAMRQNWNYRQLSRAPFVEKLQEIAAGEQSKGRFEPTAPSTTTPVLAGFRGGFGSTRPGPFPRPIPFDPGAASKAVGPILEFLRGRLSGGGGGGGGRRRDRARDEDDDNDCYSRYGKENRRCGDRLDDYHHQDFLAGCLERAKNRRDLCNRNKGRPRLDEPPEWGPKDEETWRNFDR